VRRLALLVAVLTALATGGILAHGGLRFANPLEGATLGDTPVAVQLTFSERPDPTLSSIQVLDAGGVRHDVGPPAVVPGDSLALAVRVRPLGTGIYTVNWRVVSAIDGHATAGSYAFGVRMSPEAGTTRATAPALSRLEVAGRWILIVGLIALLGAAAAEVGRFGGTRNPWLGIGGSLVSVYGVALLAHAQMQAGGVSLMPFLGTAVGRALVWRAAAVATAAVGTAIALVAGPSQPRQRLAAMTTAGIAAVIAMAVHVLAGHAGAGDRNIAATVAAQWVHFAASGVWIGGLAALLIGMRDSSPDTRAATVRRFSTVAGVGILVVVLTGTVRSLQELSGWPDVLHTGYGRVLAFKVALVVLIALLGAANRRRAVPRVPRDVRWLKLLGRGELAVAGAVLLAAALLGALPPPAAARVVPAIRVAGADFATTVRVALTALSDQPGPNRFVARVVDYDSREPVRGERVGLRFTPLDDPGVAPTSLPLRVQPDGTYAGSGANLTFDGRWRVAVLVERSNGSVEVPLDVNVKGRSDPVVVSRIPGQPITYTVVVRGVATLQFSPAEERPGPTDLSVACYDFIYDERQVAQMVMTLARDGDTPRQLPLKRVSGGRFVAAVDFTPGRYTVAAVARTMDGLRVRAGTEIVIPDR
jgi:copper transport protein